MGPFLAAVGTFIKAIFIGAAAVGATSAAYIFAVNVARVAGLALIAKLTQPSLDFSEEARAKSITVRDTLAPQRLIYGEDMISGPLLFANTSGTQNKDLFYLIGLAGHECDSVQKYRIDSDDITLGQVAGAFDGLVNAGRFANVMEIEFQHGESTQAVSTILSGAFASLWTASHTLRGWCTCVWKLTIDTVNENAYKSGVPRDFRCLVRGKKIYDPRLDSTNGGSGPQRFTDPSTWTWSSNPALALSDFIRDTKFGMGEENDRMDWPLVIAAADICDQTVTVPTPPTTQTRYTINGSFAATQRRLEIRDQLVNAMLGRVVFSQGLWKMWAGAALTADVTLTEANLAGGLQLQATSSSKDRYNRVRGKFIDAARDYAPTPYPEVRSSAFEAEDNNEITYLVADFNTVQDEFESQRNAIIMLRKSRQQRVLSWPGNFSCFRIQPGAVVSVDNAELGFAGEKFFVTEWKFGERGVELTMVEEADSVWADPIVGDYSTRSPTGTLTFADIGVPPPTGLTATAGVEGVLVQWTDPPAGSYSHIEIHAADENVRASAVIIGTVPHSPFFEEILRNERTRYYWVRAVNDAGELSAFEPDLTTTTASAAPTPLTNNIIVDADLDLSTALSVDDFFRSIVTESGTPGGTPTSVTLNIGGGADGSNSIDFVLGDPTGGAAAGTADIFTNKRIRINETSFLWKLKYRVGVNDFASIAFEARGASSPTAGPSGFVSRTIALTDTAGVWKELSVHIEPTSPLPDDARFWEFRIATGFVGAPHAVETFDLDSIFIYPVPGSFGTTVDGEVIPGAVPKALTSEAALVLSGAGTWVTNLGSDDFAFNDETGVNYTLVLADKSKIVRRDNAAANNTTVPPNSSVSFSVGTQITVRQKGVGQSSIVAGAGVTINTPETLKVEKQHAMVTLIKEDTDEWTLAGQLEPV